MLVNYCELDQNMKAKTLLIHDLFSETDKAKMNNHLS